MFVNKSAFGRLLGLPVLVLASGFLVVRGQQGTLSDSVTGIRAEREARW